TEALLREALGKARLNKDRLAGIGITNQRETTVVWDATTGEPITDAIVWQDTRTQGIIDKLAAQAKDTGKLAAQPGDADSPNSPGGTERLRSITGLPLASYFSASKIRWV